MPCHGARAGWLGRGEAEVSSSPRLQPAHWVMVSLGVVVVVVSVRDELWRAAPEPAVGWLRTSYGVQRQRCERYNSITNFEY
eukprot:5749147-Prymnesium_polylepis.1